MGNDFHYSITKAMFYIQNNFQGVSEKRGNSVRSYEVLFNPSQISISSAKTEKETDTLEKKESKRNVICYANRKNNNAEGTNKERIQLNTAGTEELVEWVSMELMFDLVESYSFYKFTEKEKDGGEEGEFINSEFSYDSFDGKKFKKEDISVFNDKCCCLKNIIDAFENLYRVMFVWGSNPGMEYKGRISNMDVVLQYFSEDGAPLRANVRLTIRTEDCGDVFN